MINDFYRATTVIIDIQILYNGSAPNITNDEVRMMVKSKKSDPDEDALINETFDVSEGATGSASLELTPTDTDIEPGVYFYEIFWLLSGGREYVLESGEFKIKTRVKEITD
jgi:hypothetical protein